MALTKHISLSKPHSSIPPDRSSIQQRILHIADYFLHRWRYQLHLWRTGSVRKLIAYSFQKRFRYRIKIIMWERTGHCSQLLAAMEIFMKP
jgi:hypothetical protein